MNATQALDRLRIAAETDEERAKRLTAPFFEISQRAKNWSATSGEGVLDQPIQYDDVEERLRLVEQIIATPGPLIVLVDWYQHGNSPGEWGHTCWTRREDGPVWLANPCLASRVVTREGCAVFRQVCYLDWGHEGEHRP